MNSLLSPSPSPTSLVSDSCWLDKGLIIPWICQALTSSMSSGDWCTDSCSLPAKQNPFYMGDVAVIEQCVSMVPFRCPSSPYWVLRGHHLGGRPRPWGGVGRVSFWLTRERTSALKSSNRLCSMVGPWWTVHLLFPSCEEWRNSSALQGPQT